MGASVAGRWLWEQFGEVKTGGLALATLLAIVEESWRHGAGLVAVVVVVSHNGRVPSPQSHVADGRVGRLLGYGQRRCFWVVVGAHGGA